MVPTSITNIDTLTPDQLQAREVFLLKLARALQAEQCQLAKRPSRKTAQRFGDLERQLEGRNGIWRQIDQVRKALGVQL